MTFYTNDSYIDGRIMRKEPPNAFFFARTNGKEIRVIGPPEEKYLNKIESHVLKRKEMLEKRDIKRAKLIGGENYLNYEIARANKIAETNKLNGYNFH